jgi:hypothetical protein
MSDDLNEPWTQERFFAWAEAQDPGYEFDGHFLLVFLRQSEPLVETSVYRSCGAN